MLEKNPISEQKKQSREWFLQLRNRICDRFEALERQYSEIKPSDNSPPAVFLYKKWQRGQDYTLSRKNPMMPERSDSTGDDGGEMAMMCGRLFEKVGVNISTVEGEFSPDFRKEIPGAEKDGKFWAAGISVVAHMHSPLIPAVHMNTRFIVTRKSWFGGGADLNPVFPDKEETDFFHQKFKTICDSYRPGSYEEFSDWCDRYFHIPHRDRPRGVGGIFYDALASGDWEKDFAFTRKVGETFLEAFAPLVEKNMAKSWTPEQKAEQLEWRGLYTEFNLVYDRGTRFGLMTGGNPEAVLMSLPPVASWGTPSSLS